jgi:hypothetical protein
MSYVLPVTVPFVTAQAIDALYEAAGPLARFINAVQLDNEKAAADYAIKISSDSVHRSGQAAHITGVESVTRSALGDEWIVRLNIFD